MFRGYLHEEERYRKNFVGEWYLTGDLAMRDTDGYYWFVGREDDVIKTSGHLIGPFEVESALLEHPAVSEIAVIGIPDTVAGETVKAFVALKDGVEQSEGFARNCSAILANDSARLWRRNRSIFDQSSEDAQRQDHAPTAEGERARTSGRRHIDAGKRRKVSNRNCQAATVAGARWRSWGR